MEGFIPDSRFSCSDIKNLTKETLEKQYELVKLRTSNNGTYNQGSHVMQFGDLIIDEEPAADYLGKLNTGKPAPAQDREHQGKTGSLLPRRSSLT